MSSLSIITRPAKLLPTADLRQHCRVDGTHDDELIDAYQAAAQRECEMILGRPVGQTVYRLALDSFPAGDDPILLPRPPVVSIDSLDYTDADGAAASLNVSTEIQADTWTEPGRIFPNPGDSWPETQIDRVNAVVIQFTAGSDDVDDVGQEVAQAIRMAVANWYKHREPAAETSLSTIPNGFFRLLKLNRFRDPELTQFLNEF